MPSRRDQIVMSEDEIQAYLNEQRILNVATNSPTGHPHLVAMWFTVLDGNPAFWTFGRSQKIVNIRRDDKISGLVESGDSYNELRGVEMTGRARLIEDRAPDLRDRQGGRSQVHGTRGAPRRQPAVHRSPGGQAARRGDRRRTLGELGPHQTRRRLLSHPHGDLSASIGSPGPPGADSSGFAARARRLSPCRMGYNCDERMTKCRSCRPPARRSDV